ncbi:MAG: hypothetical protein U0694_01290 [Anaerolineae bacterium]
MFRPVDASDGLTYWQWNYRAFDNSTIWQIHQQEINDMVAYVDGMGARLIVVIFPNLQDPVGSIAYVDRVAQAIEATGHDEILRLYDDVAALGSQNVIVSRRDAHPNAMFHHVVAQRIYELSFAARSAHAVSGWLPALLLLAAFLRFHALAQDVRFHADEALFATFARSSAALDGQWLFPGALDKPR